MPVAPEVNSFEREVSGHQQFLSRSQAQHRAVIADSCRNDAACGAGTPARRSPPTETSRHTTYLGNERFFSEWHGGNYYNALATHDRVRTRLRPGASANCLPLIVCQTWHGPRARSNPVVHKPAGNLSSARKSYYPSVTSIVL